MRYHLGANPLKGEKREVLGDLVRKGDTICYRILNSDKMRPFFLTMVSSSDHWIFLGSKGGISAGRRNRDQALFPYYTDDKIMDMSGVTGHRAIVRVELEGTTYIWEPFSDIHLSIYNAKRNLYKAVTGDTVCFEEENPFLGITFCYSWHTSSKYGIIKKSTLINNRDHAVSADILDGMQNIMPWGVEASMQDNYSTLVDAYKISRLDKESGAGLFSLASIPADRAIPNEALRCNTVWSTGLKPSKYLLSADQADNFAGGRDICSETSSRGVKGAYMINSNISLGPAESKRWYFVMEVACDNRKVDEIVALINSPQELPELLEQDISEGRKKLISLVRKSDGIESSSDLLTSYRHYSNVLFNIMRGGTFADNYNIHRSDFLKYLQSCNRKLLADSHDFISSIPPVTAYQHLVEEAGSTGNGNLLRVVSEYLPLVFSRRHGDPSRPWNRFDIRMDENKGRYEINYQGNWRDIFQNWEALAYSFPLFLPAMVSKFLNASSIDGYNPYRITSEGIEWERPDTDDPWAHIGYWGDHQIIYLLKLIDLSERFIPESVGALLNSKQFSYADIPYSIKKWEEIIKNPSDTIIFDYVKERASDERVKSTGSDGRLLPDSSGNIVLATFTEKILVSLLAKFTAFIPDGGIWMNTQRPEWNDANNALAGNGISMVTLYHIRKMVLSLERLYNNSESSEFNIRTEVYDLFTELYTILRNSIYLLPAGLTPQTRMRIVESLGEAGSRYREKVYNKLSGRETPLKKSNLLKFFHIALEWIDTTISNNRRDDGLFHSYNLLVKKRDGISTEPLQEMLEGQVAILGSGFLTPEETANLISALFNSRLYRTDQDSFMLYPDKETEGFREKNCIPAESVKSSKLLTGLLNSGDSSVVTDGLQGKYHFNSDIRNRDELLKALGRLPSGFRDDIRAEKELVCDIYESVFNHRSFTGRSGSFFKYEGLGSIYWHMVSKLRLVIAEIIAENELSGQDNISLAKIRNLYYRVRSGIGMHKSPADYGAFPIDPYSHTPSMSGAQQPGMTGQVKEDIISRRLELGIRITNGELRFNPSFLRETELTGISGRSVPLEYSLCGIPVTTIRGDSSSIKINYVNGKQETIEGLSPGKEISNMVFTRSNDIESLELTIESELLLKD